MSKLRKELKKRAELELTDILRDVKSALEGIHPGIEAEELAALAFGKRSATLRKKVVSRMVATLEEEVLAEYTRQHDFVDQVKVPADKPVAQTAGAANA